MIKDGIHRLFWATAPMPFLAVVICLGLGFLPSQGNAQMDTEFWFVSPQIHTEPPVFSEIMSWRCFEPNAVVNVTKPALGTWVLENYTSPYNTLHLQISSYNNNPPAYNTVDSVCHYNTVSDHAYLVTSSSEAMVSVSITNPNAGSYPLSIS